MSDAVKEAVIRMSKEPKRHPSTVAELFDLCPKCGRSECDLKADVIIGERNYRAAVADCIAWQRRPIDGQKFVGTGRPR